MTTSTEIFILSGARTAIGSFGGGLASLRPAELGEIVIREAISRAGLAPADIQNVVIGTVVATQPKDAYVSRVAAVKAGIPIDTPAMNVNRLCGSGLQAIVSAAQGIALGEQDIAIGGGAEHVECAFNVPHGTQWPEDGRPDPDGYHARRSSRPLREYPYGRYGGECG